MDEVAVAQGVVEHELATAASESAHKVRMVERQAEMIEEAARRHDIGVEVAHGMQQVRAR